MGDLGSVLLSIGVDDAPLKAGFARARQLAESAGNSIVKGLAGNGGTLTGLNIKLATLQDELQNVQIGTKRFRELRGEIERTQKSLSKAQGLGGGGAFGGFAAGLAGLGIGAAATGFLKGSIDAAVELESITRKLSNTLGEKGAAGALNFTRQLSDQLGLSFKTLASSFGSFTAAASSAGVPLETQKNLFAAVSKAGQQLGLSNDEISGSLLALQQVAAKGTVQMEELRGQLGERLPIAFAATAEGLGVTQTQLIKLVETGKLTAEQFFPALTKGLNALTKESKGAATTAQNFQKLANAWDNLQTSFGSNLIPGVTSSVETLTDVLGGLGVVLEANKLGLGGGILTNALGIIPEQGSRAVGALQALANQYELTGQQARALFTDAVKEVGAKPNAFGQLTLSAKEFEQILTRLPLLAEQFDLKNRGISKEQRQQKVLLGELAALASTRYAKQSQEAQQIAATNNLILKGRADIDKAYGLYTKLQDPKLGTSNSKLNEAADLVNKSYQNFRELMVQGARDVANILTEAVNKLTDARLNLASLQGAQDKGLNKYLNPDQRQLRLNTATASLQPDLERAISIATNLLKPQGISLDKTFIGDLRGIVAGAAGQTKTVGTLNGKPIVAEAGPQATAQGLDRVQQFIRDALGENSAVGAVKTATQNLSDINAQLATVNSDLLKQVEALAKKDWAVQVNVDASGRATAYGDVLNGALS